ncbi:uncharacterized protein LOC132564181 [Ylistrum balloti]|uniref:uncharacterized protein LOC132564181 n=1 Tax=Ylistrum balloti TaxID=509963 RepID=UPI002905E353|nr:uncharacterized protein LOC132564181 [Ylistrum balloti]
MPNISAKVWLCQMQSCTTDSGYVHLLVKHHGKAFFPSCLGDDISILDYDETSECYYFTNAVNAKMLRNFGSYGLSSGVDILGPCLALSEVNEDMNLNMVVGMKCSEWPSVAAEWISRERSNGWPPRGFIDQQIMRGCHVVPVGCKGCEQTHRDWRISFAHVEQEIVHNMTANQMKCFILLRQLKKFFFKVKIPDVITSYIIKTTLFWTIEQSSPELWQPHKLSTAVKVCLNKLILFVQNDFCPHYFIRTCNLLFGRYSLENKSNVLQTCLEARRNQMKILCETPPFAKALSLRHRGEQLSKQRAGQLKSDADEWSEAKFHSTDVKRILEDLLQDELRQILSTKDTTLKLEEYCIRVRQQIDDSCFKSRQRCKQEMRKCRKLIHDVTERLLHICWLGPANREELLDVSAFLNDEEDVNNISNTCHVLMLTEDYSRCHDILGKFITAQKRKDYRRLLKLEYYPKELQVKREDINRHIIGAGEELLNISDLIFLQIEENTLPTPLQTEFCQIVIGHPEVDAVPEDRPTVVVDPLVYICFLRFWCSMKMDQNIEKLKARDDMAWCCGVCTISQKSVALNLLAFCHCQLEEYEGAFEALCRAFREKPAKCSTLVHIACLINNRLL